ncbi:MAG: hypothetical protein LRY30_00130, partial [Gammaproteobacteria bacterium]|nr:hypothetical protein [Gammaproteobacteria bacterium]
MLEQVKCLLENMGIHCVIYFGKKYKTYFNGEKDKQVFKLYVEKTCFSSFRDKIGFIGRQKTRKLNKIDRIS